MTDDPARRSRWWTDRDEPADGLDDPWPGDGDTVALSEEQVRFLRSLADQPQRPRLRRSPPGLENLLGDGPGPRPAPETGD